MHFHKATISWKRDNDTFTDSRYNRVHTWKFDGGIEIVASPSPHIVPVPFSSENAVDPEEAFVASVSSCHMLTFLYIASKKGFCVNSYLDEAIGTMSKIENRLAITSITLKPMTEFCGRIPTQEELNDMHHSAHEECFIANSIKTAVVCEAILL